MERLGQIGILLGLLGLFIVFAFFDPFSFFSGGESVVESQEVVAPRAGEAVWNNDVTMNPSVVYDSEAQLYRAWYISQDSLGVGRVGYAQGPSPSSLDVTIAPDPVFEPVDGWELGGITDITVLQDGATYHMWYSAKSTNDRDAQQSIGYATSNNGTRWTRFNGNPILSPRIAQEVWDRESVMDPSVLRVGNAWHMWYVGQDAEGISRIGYTVSSSPSSWSGSAEPIIGTQDGWAQNGVRSPNVTRPHGTQLFEMWYTGLGSRNHASIGRALSDNGTTWTPFEENPWLSDKTDSVLDPNAVQGRVEVDLFFTRAEGRDGQESVHHAPIVGVNGIEVVDVFQ